ncbi:Protein tumorous imaginal discs, mitochondrial [Cucurbita argyrosperma subsp. argyrosperma]|nr:Protein tumorous imaginal discs, mitochondrial [Cucurbita argyrosperma subsp. argyrosperma]
MSGAWEDNHNDTDSDHQHSHINFDFFSAIVKPKDYYKILEVGYDATDDEIRSNYIRLALKWHPDKKKDHDGATSRFQEINEAYEVLSDPCRRQEYDEKGMLYVNDDNIVVRSFFQSFLFVELHYDASVQFLCSNIILFLQDYLKRYKGLILTCNGLGMKHSIW